MSIESISVEKLNGLILISARWEAICEILEGEETSEFMLSFPEVRQVADLCAANQSPHISGSVARFMQDPEGVGDKGETDPHDRGLEYSKAIHTYSEDEEERGVEDG